MTGRAVVAVDLGAESGRVTRVEFDGQQLALDIVSRFEHQPREQDGVLRWDVEGLWSSIDDGLSRLAAGDVPVASVGVDTWGVDYGLLDASGELVDAPTCYRDPRGQRAHDEVVARIGVPRLYDATGVQIMPINTLFSLAADARWSPERLERAATLVMMPDVFHQRMSGAVVSEYTAVSTTGAYDMAGNRWATDILEEIGVPTRILPEVVPPGTDVGALRGAAGALQGARVILPAGHDTASAVVATPFADPGGVFISSGTWSLVGTEIPTALVTEQTRRANLTNEGGYAGSIRLLRNVMGLWILQQCRRRWAAEGVVLDYPAIADAAGAVAPLRSLIDPDDALFLPPGDMPARIRAYCAATGQPVPTTVGEIARCVVDSLALSYRAVVEALAAVTGRAVPSISVVGGGSQHRLLQTATAEATGLPVHCGPVEATALGNAAVQLVTLGELDDVRQIREVIAAGTRLTTVQPGENSGGAVRPAGRDAWDEAFARHRRLAATAFRDLPAAASSGAPS